MGLKNTVIFSDLHLVAIVSNIFHGLSIFFLEPELFLEIVRKMMKRGLPKYLWEEHLSTLDILRVKIVQIHRLSMAISLCSCDETALFSFVIP